MAVWNTILRIVTSHAAALLIARLSILKALTVALLAIRLNAFTIHFLFDLDQCSCDVLCLRLQFAFLIGQEGLTLWVAYFVFARNALTVEPTIATVLNTLTIQLKALRLFAMARLELFLTVLGRLGLLRWSVCGLWHQL
jgi:hypothetical protein